MGTILYKPHCAECGALIEDDIMYRGLIERVVSSKICRESLVMVYPNKCKCCGEPFNSIEIPLPKKIRSYGGIIMTLDLYTILVGFGLACCAGAPLYLYFNLIMAMVELDSEEKEKEKE